MNDKHHGIMQVSAGLLRTGLILWQSFTIIVTSHPHIQPLPQINFSTNNKTILPLIGVSQVIIPVFDLIKTASRRHGII